MRTNHTNTSPEENSILAEKECIVCGQSFIPNCATHIYCSATCKSRVKWAGRVHKASKELTGERELECLQCHHVFTPVKSQQKYCSQACRFSASEARRLERRANQDAKVFIRTCKQCGKEYEDVGIPKHYCSPECRVEGKRERSRRVCRKKGDKQRELLPIRHLTCPECGDEFETKALNGVYCSAACRRSVRVKRDAKRRIDSANGPARFVILNRDGFKCAYCGASPIQDGVKLHVDHIIPVRAGGLSVAGNLITACSDCNCSKKDVIISNVDEVLAEVKRRNRLAGIDSKSCIKGLSV